MVLEGVVSNVANFGAFVDIGVHQDGLVHISAITNKFIKDPREVVKTGDIVKVKVVEVDVKRRRISLTMRLDDAMQSPAPANIDKQKGRHSHKETNKRNRVAPSNNKSHQKGNANSNAIMGNAFAAAFAKAKK